jgi:light-regulated signal transduction histidine kinase (bacteriophytochrome)
VQGQEGVTYLRSATYTPPADLARAVARLQRRVRELEGVNEQLDRANADLTRSNDDLARFAVIASHDLAEPMRATAWFIQLLERHYAADLDERATQWMSYALNGLEEMTTLVDGLLLYSRAGAATEAHAYVDTGALVEEVLRTLQRAADDAGATITLGPLPAVAGDPLQLRRLFQNLLTNAIKFRADGRPPEIEVAGACGEDFHCFSVTDNGVGIPPPDRKRVFHMFDRGQGEGFDGHGLGLAICERVVGRHRGHIWIDGGPCGGTRVVFTLPAVRS